MTASTQLNYSLSNCLCNTSITHIHPDPTFNMVRAPLPMLCGNYDPSLFTAGEPWYISEKYDGWRMYYMNGTFYSRTGKELKTIPHIAAAIPSNLPANTVLDGELWLGYDGFPEIGTAIEASDSRLQWILYDIPSAPGNYAERYEMLQSLFPAHNHAHPITVVSQFCVDNMDDADTFYEALLAENSKVEGVVYRPASLPYMWNERSDIFMKRKPMKDIEVLVIGYHTTTENKLPRPDGYVSSLICEMMDTQQQLRVSFRGVNPPEEGTIITIKYQNLTENGVPRFPIFKGIRGKLDAPFIPRKITTTATQAGLTLTLPKSAVVVTSTTTHFDMKPGQRVCFSLKFLIE